MSSTTRTLFWTVLHCHGKSSVHELPKQQFSHEHLHGYVLNQCQKCLHTPCKMREAISGSFPLPSEVPQHMWPVQLRKELVPLTHSRAVQDGASNILHTPVPQVAEIQKTKCPQSAIGSCDGAEQYLSAMCLLLLCMYRRYICCVLPKKERHTIQICNFQRCDVMRLSLLSLLQQTEPQFVVLYMLGTSSGRCRPRWAIGLTEWVTIACGGSERNCVMVQRIVR